MTNPGTDAKLLQIALDAYDACGENQSEAARSLGWSRPTFCRRLKLSQNSGYKLSISKEVEFPTLPEDDISIEEQLDIMESRFKREHEYQQAKKWMSYKVNIDGPIGIMWFGDPHIDDNGCNIPLLRKHIKICNDTVALYGANIGDTTNNWVGRLMRLFADQDTSQKTAQRLAKWFLLESGVDWILWLMGNHDLWNEGDVILRGMNIHKIPIEDWGAKFKLVFPNGVEIKINAAHDHKGISQFNPLHGQQKAYLWGEPAHLFIAGHRHNWACMHQEDPEKGFTYWMARARGYKYIDHFSQIHGFPIQQEGAAILTVIDPYADTEAGKMYCFADVEKGAKFLTFLRAEHENCHTGKSIRRVR